MNLIRTDWNFSNLMPKDKINLLRGLATGQIEETVAPELKFTVFTDEDGNHKLTPGGESIDLAAWETIENYLKGKYPLNRVSINEIKMGNINGKRKGNKAA
jgi:hypothetical protein